MRLRQNHSKLLVMAAWLAIVLNSASALAQRYTQTNIVSDIPNKAITTDPNLKNAWGIAFGPGSPIWVADNGTGLSTLYTGTGTIVPLVVTIPAPMSGDTSAPTGLVFTGGVDFVVSQNGKSGPSIFIFDTEDGTIVGWSPAVDTTNGVIAVPNDHGAIYKGLAIAKTAKGSFLYASDFHNGVVEIYNSKFKLQKTFTDSSLPPGYAPFGIKNINGQIFVTFAKQDALKEDEIAGPGLGFVDIFDTDGNLVRRFASLWSAPRPGTYAWDADHAGAHPARRFPHRELSQAQRTARPCNRSDTPAASFRLERTDSHSSSPNHEATRAE